MADLDVEIRSVEAVEEDEDEDMDKAAVQATAESE